MSDKNEDLSDIYPRINTMTDNILSVSLNPDPIQQKNDVESKLTTFFLEDLISENPITPKNTIINIISKFIKSSKFIRKIERDGLIDKKVDILNLSVSCANHLQFFKIKKGDILFKIGDFGDKFYFLLKGRVEVLKLININNTERTYNEYFSYLQFLRKNNEFYILNEVLSKNYNIVEISNIGEFDKMYKIYFKNQLTEMLLNNNITKIEELKDFFSDYSLKLSDLEINEEELEKIIKTPYDQQSKKNILGNKKSFEDNQLNQYILEKSKTSTLEEVYFEPYEKLLKENKKHPFIKLVYEPFLYLGPGDCFGDSALDSIDHKRNATIKANEDCYLGYLNSTDYLNLISPKKKNKKAKDITFLYDTFFFYNINFHLFEKHYFHLFISEEYNRGNILFFSKSMPKHLIILQKGKIQLNLSCSILNLHNLMNSLYDKLINGKYYQTIIEKRHIITNEELFNLKTLIYDNDIARIKSQNDSFIYEMNKKRNFTLCLLTDKELVGIEEIFLDIPYICTAKVISQKAFIFKLEKKKFNTMIEDEKGIVVPYIKISTNKLISLIERCYNVKKTMIEMIKATILKEKEEIFKENYNSNNSPCSSQIKLYKSPSDLFPLKSLRKGKILKNNKKNNVENEKFDSSIFNFKISKNPETINKDNIISSNKSIIDNEEDNKIKKNSNPYIVLGDKKLNIKFIRNEVLNFKSIKKRRSSLQVIQSNKKNNEISDLSSITKEQNQFNEFNENSFNTVEYKNIQNFTSFRLGFVHLSTNRNPENKNEELKKVHEKSTGNNLIHLRKFKYSNLKKLSKKSKSIININENHNPFAEIKNEEKEEKDLEEIKNRIIPDIIKDFYFKIKRKGYAAHINKSKYNTIYNNKYMQINRKAKTNLPRIRNYST